jgi:cytochrome P450 family 142 subfamily A polypeptide 1
MAVAPDIAIADGAFWGRNPHDELAWLRANDPVHWDEAAGVWGISRYDDVKAVSTQPDVFSNAGGIRPDTGPIAMMIDMDDPEHLRRRQLVNKGFTPRRVRDQEDRIREVVDRLIDQVGPQGGCDFVQDIAAWLPLVMIGDALGVEEKDHPTLLQWSDDLMRGQGTTDEGLLEAMIGAFAGYTGYITEVMEDRKACPRDDLMSILCTAEVDGESFDDDEIIHESLLILIGGDETTRHVITGGLYQLLRNRSQWEMLQADASLLDGAVEESLRWVTPIKNMARTATRDVEMHGRTIREGQKLLLLYPSANRDEAHFTDPMTFDITRSPNDHVAFGFGTHFCLGASLARLELKVAFSRVLERLPDIRLVDKTEPGFRPASFVSGYESMPVAFTPVTPIRA